MIRRWDPVSRHQASTKIASLTKDIDKHLAWSGLMHMVRSQEQTRKIVDRQNQIMEAVASLSISAITSQAGHAPIGTINSKKIEQGDKTLTGTASGLSNLPGVSSFQDQQLDCHLTWDEPPSYESTMMPISELYENPMVGCVKEDFVSHHVEEEEDRTENQRFGQALCDFPALSVDELSLTAGEEVEILEEQGGWFYVSKKWPGGDGKVSGWVHALFVNSSYSSFSMAATKHLQGDKTITGTASGLSNLSKVSLFQDQQLESLDSVSNDVEEKDRTENQWFGQALCDFPARRDDELNLTAGEEVEILQIHGERFYVSKKQPGTNTKVAGWVHKLFVNSYNSH